MSVTVPPPNVNPVADFTSNCVEWTCTFDSSSSTDSDGTIASYAWSFEGGGTSTAANPTHAFTANGSYDVTLTVTDNRGGTDAQTKEVAVHKNTPPVASFTVTCDELECEFNSSASTDPDGTIASLLWDFGDGSTSTAANPTHAYASADSYDVVLTVTDNDGGTHTDTQSVSVSTNSAPNAAYTFNCTNLACSFNGSGSTDPDGTIASYAWDWDDSTPQGSGASPNHTYAAAGGYDVTLTVTDNNGATDTVTNTVNVTAPPAGPIAADTFNRTVTRWGTADTGGTYTYSGSTFATDGSKGTIRLASAGVSATASLAAVSARDVNVLADFSVDKMATGGGTFNSLVVRRIGTSDYRLAFKEQSNGTVNLTISRTVNGTATTLQQATLSGVTYVAGDTFRVRFTASGNGTTNLSAKAWKVGTSEPAAAQVTATDSTAALQAAGSFQIVSYLSGSSTNAPVTTSVDNLSITAP